MIAITQAETFPHGPHFEVCSPTTLLVLTCLAEAKPSIARLPRRYLPNMKSQAAISLACLPAKETGAKQLADR